MANNPPFKYHQVLRKIYENFGLEWFRFKQLHDLEVLHYESEGSARTKMNDMCYTERWKKRRKNFLQKESYEKVAHLFPNANKYEKKSKFWRVSEEGIKELVEVFSDLEIEDKHVPLIAKAYLDK